MKIDLRTRLRLECFIRVPRHRVYAAWTDPSIAAKWWSPEDYSVVSTACDPVIGGRFELRAEAPLGGNVLITGRYHAMDPNERVVFTWEMPECSPMPETRIVTVEFADYEDGTRMSIFETGVVGLFDDIATVLSMMGAPLTTKCKSY